METPLSFVLGFAVFGGLTALLFSIQEAVGKNVRERAAYRWVPWYRDEDSTTERTQEMTTDTTPATLATIQARNLAIGDTVVWDRNNDTGEVVLAIVAHIRYIDRNYREIPRVIGDTAPADTFEIELGVMVHGYANVYQQEFAAAPAETFEIAIRTLRS